MFSDSVFKKLTVLTVAGAMFVSSSLPSANAGMIAVEESIAGINMPLDRFVISEVQAGAVGPAADNSSNDNILPSEADIISTDVDDEGMNDDEEDDVIDEHVKLNINYDRLGIADVDNYLNVRSKASTSAKIVGKLTKHAGCHIYSIKKGWAKIVSGNVKGYVKAEYLVTDKEAEDLAMKVGKKVATVNVQGLRVRALPSTDSSIYSVLSKDEDFVIHKEKLSSEWLDKFIKKNVKKKQVKKVDMDSVEKDLENWVCISVDNDYAFVAKEYIDISYKLNRAVKIGELATDGTSGVSSTRASIVEYAKQFLGNRYVYGGTSLTNGTDCSGFSMRVFQHFGIGLPRTSGNQAASTRSIKGSEAKPGDLFFYGGGGHVSHVAIYIGSGMVIHASNPSSGIKISNAYYRSPIKIGRVISD